MLVRLYKDYHTLLYLMKKKIQKGLNTCQIAKIGSG